MKSKNGFRMAQTTRKRGARLTAGRLKRIQDFKIVSLRNTFRYGRLGTPKWAQELRRFLDDERLTREDVQRWIDTKSEVTDPLPEKGKSDPKTKSSPDELWSVTGRPLRTCRHSELLLSTSESHMSTSERSSSTPGRSKTSTQRSRLISESSSRASSTDSRYSGNTIETPATYASKRNRNYDALFSPSPVHSAPDSTVSDFDLLNFRNGLQNDSEESSRISFTEKNPFIPPKPSQSVIITEQPDIDMTSKEVILRDVRNGFLELKFLCQLARKYTTHQRNLVRQIRKIYSELVELENIGNSAEIPEPYSLAIRQDMDENLNNENVDPFEEVILEMNETAESDYFMET